MTPRQAETLSFIRAYRKRHGYSPCYRVIGSALGLSSKATVHKHVSALVRDGHLKHIRSRVIPLVARAPA